MRGVTRRLAWNSVYRKAKIIIMQFLRNKILNQQLERIQKKP